MKQLYLAMAAVLLLSTSVLAAAEEKHSDGKAETATAETQHAEKKSEEKAVEKSSASKPADEKTAEGNPPGLIFKECMVHCVDPHPACSESERVIETLQLIYRALAKQDFQTVAEYTDEHCTTIDEGKHKVVSGKEAVLKDVEARFERYRNSDSPLVSYTIERPYAHVTGDTAVVTFRAIKEFGGKHPQKFESHCTDIFVKHGDKWKKMHYRCKWTKIS